MDDNNLSEESGPVDDAPLTYDQEVEGISELLDGPEADPEEPAEDQNEAAEAEGEPEAEAEDVEEPEAPDDEPEDDSPDDAEIKGGRFAPDSAKVRLDNGQTITVGDLKTHVDRRVRDFQRDYTDKTQKLKAKESEVDQYAQSLNQSRDYLAWYAENYLRENHPGQPPSAAEDPIGFQQWQEKAYLYQQHQQAWQQFQAEKQAGDERKADESRKEAEAHRATELDALLNAVPVLKDPAKRTATLESWARGADKHYGVTRDELNALSDHRYFLILKDALELRQLKAKAGEVQKQVAAKPPMRGGKRGSPQESARRQRQVRSEQLRQTGSFDDGVRALMDLDL